MSTVITRHDVDGQGDVLSGAALDLIASLHRTFDGRRQDLLKARRGRVEGFANGGRPAFLDETEAIRVGDWKVRPAPVDLQDRRVEITGPTDRKMMINALNSGARVFMADLEDSSTPSWERMITGQINLRDAVERTIEFTNPDGRQYQLADDTATLLVRPRGWHLSEKHLLVDGEAVSGSIFDAALYLFHNARRLIEQGSGPYLYLPKLEGHLEARLWNDVLNAVESHLGLEPGTTRVTVLIETVLAAFEMDEILYELRSRIVGLNAGRWDYIFSVIKNLRHDASAVLPDRGQITMTVPFMRAYTELMVKTCHRRGAHAIGGMAAFIPSRTDPEVTETALAKVRADKEREAADGCDGTWVAHPGLVGLATEIFDAVLGERPNQIDRSRVDVDVAASDLITTSIEGGTITEHGLRTNVRVGVMYLESWLSGNGAAALFNLMEDAATAEISRSQIWQWVRHGAGLDDGRVVTDALVRQILADELGVIRGLVGDDRFDNGRYPEAEKVFVDVALGDEFVDFLTLPAGELID